MRTIELLTVGLAVAGLSLSPALAKGNICGTAAREDSAGAMLKYKSGSVTVAIHKGLGGYTLHEGWNDIDRPARLECVNPAGCLLAALGVVPSIGNPGFICTFLDGHFMRPSAESVPVNLQSKPIILGKHRVRTMLFVYGGQQARLGAWEIQYTLYDQ